MMSPSPSASVICASVVMCSVVTEEFKNKDSVGS